MKAGEASVRPHWPLRLIWSGSFCLIVALGVELGVSEALVDARFLGLAPRESIALSFTTLLRSSMLMIDILIERGH